tara:strand:+ start:8026 stop:8151 length:126 start_codon:yes stop_codon:yes gene_type:complete
MGIALLDPPEGESEHEIPEDPIEQETANDGEDYFSRHGVTS